MGKHFETCFFIYIRGKLEAFTFTLRNILLSKCSHLIALSHEITKQAAGKLFSWPPRCLFQLLLRNNVGNTFNKVVLLELDACQ